jgi:hypothetical protein
MAKTGLKNEEFVSEILVSGSLKLKPKNSFGVNFFEEVDIKDGVTSAKLVKPKYDNSELVKSIDTDIFELIPIRPAELPDMVLRSIYNVATQSIIDLTAEIVELNGTILDLSGKVKELEIVTQSLRVDVDNQSLLAAASQNQATLTNSKIQSSIIELQNSIQKATAESIQRVSLFARNESLKEQNDILRETLFGKQAKQAEGAKVTDDVSAKVLTKGEDRWNELAFRGRAKDDGRGSWINGPDVELKNFTKDKITVSFKFEGDNAKAFTTPPNIDLAAGEQKVIKISTIDKQVDSFRPKSAIGFTGDKEYTGTLIIKSPKGTISFTTSIQKMRGDKFEP